MLPVACDLQCALLACIGLAHCHIVVYAQQPLIKVSLSSSSSSCGAVARRAQSLRHLRPSAYIWTKCIRIKTCNKKVLLHALECTAAFKAMQATASLLKEYTSEIMQTEMDYCTREAQLHGYYPFALKTFLDFLKGSEFAAMQAEGARDWIKNLRSGMRGLSF
jgi:hypothetical protein